MSWSGRLQMKIRHFVFAGICAWLSALPAYAHRKGIPVTTIEWNDRSNAWELTHRLSAHDLEDALGLGLGFEDLEPAKLSVLLRDYVEEHFYLVGVVSLSYLGAEEEGDDIWVYYQLTGFDQPVAINNRLLLDTDATSTALMNVTSGNETKSYTFDQTTGWIATTLARPDKD